MADRIAAFTDTYLPTVNGVTYTLRSWRARWHRLGGRMDVVFPESAYEAGAHEHPVRSVGFPWYDGYRVGEPRIPNSLSSVDLVHAHTPFAVGLAAVRFARQSECPLVASYHTPAAEYASYVAPIAGLTGCVRRAARAYERRFYDRADLVIAPTHTARRHVRETVGVSTPVRVVGNGVDLERFRPVDSTAFRRRYDLEEAATLLGYTGRHGYEKNLEELLEAVAGIGPRHDIDDVTVVFGGDGPARRSLENRAAELGVDARFLGFLEREELPAFYSALDAFAFPSPVETQGLVALESIACATPVVAVDAGALSETVVDGETGTHYRPGAGGPRRFREAIRRTLAEQGRLEHRCLARREGIGVSTAIERLGEAYASLEDR